MSSTRPEDIMMEPCTSRRQEGGFQYCHTGYSFGIVKYMGRFAKSFKSGAIEAAALLYEPNYSAE